MELVAKLLLGIFSALMFVFMAIVMIIWQPIAWVIAKLIGVDTK